MNVLFILSDSHSREFTGCYTGTVETPNIDSIARRGTLFSNAYCCSPICAPTRSALFSGRYVHETGVWDNATAYSGTPASWPAWLRQQGALFTSIGRLDCLPDADTGIEDKRLPGVRGSFDPITFFREQETVQRRAEYYAYYDIRIRRQGTALPEEESEPGDRAITREAVNWIRKERPADRPWVLYVGYNHPHPEWAPDGDLYDKYLNAAAPLSPKYLQPIEDLHPYDQCSAVFNCSYHRSDENRIQKIHAAYRAVVEEFDREVGQILDAMEEEGIRDDTLIIYSSDHGESARAHGNMGKTSMYEESIGIPLILSGPEIRPGAVVDAPVSQLDFFPTVADAMDVPADDGFRGNSILPLARGEAEEFDARPVFIEHHAGPAPRAIFALRLGEWKYVENVGESPCLYNLAEDPDEMFDLVKHKADDPAVRGQLERFGSRLREICSPEEVDALAHSDQRRRMQEMKESGDLAQQVYYRGYEKSTEKLVPWDWSEFEALRVDK